MAKPLVRIDDSKTPPVTFTRNEEVRSATISRWRLSIALCIAVVSDVTSVFTEFLPPLQVLIDMATAMALFVILGWRWEILPALVGEAIPGMAVLPFWIVVVAIVAARSNRS